MLDKLRKLGNQTFYYGLGSILNKLLGFILIPIYQSHIPIGNFGNLVYFETIIVFLSALLNFGIAPAHQRFFYIEHEKKAYGTYLFNNFFGCLLLATISIVPVLFFSESISSIICKSSTQSVNLQITMWIVVTEIMYVLPLQVLQYEEKPGQYLFFNAVKLIITFTITIVLVINFSLGFEGVMFARLAGGIITLLLATSVIILPRCTFKIELNGVKQAIKFGFPYVISTLGYSLFMVSDRFMLNWLSTDEQLGKYGFGFKIANFINLIFVQTIGMSYFPSVMSNESKADNVRYYRKMLTYYCFFIVLCILSFLFFYRDILWIVGKNKEYWEGLKVVPLLSLSFMIMGMNYFVGVGLFLKKQTFLYVIPSFAAVVVNILMNIWLIPLFGMMGAAYSVVVAQMIYAGLLSFLSSKHLKIDFEWGKIFTIYILGIVFFEASNYFPIQNFWIISIVRLVMLMMFPLILYKLNFFEAIEIQRVKEGFNKVLTKLKVHNQ